MSLYVTGGTLGVACGPLVGALLTHFFGLHGTILMIVPGATIAILMLIQMRTISLRVVRHAKSAASGYGKVPYRTLAVVIAMMALRSWTISGLQNYVPTWYKDLGYSSFYYGALVTTLLVSTALGTVGSGTVADKYGRRFPIIASAILSLPTILIFAQYPGNYAFLWIGLIGFLAASTMPLLLVIAQELMSNRAGMATGLVLGLGFAFSAVGVPITGAIADQWGIQNAMRGAGDHRSGVGRGRVPAADSKRRSARSSRASRRLARHSGMQASSHPRPTPHPEQPEGRRRRISCREATFVSRRHKGAGARKGPHPKALSRASERENEGSLRRRDPSTTPFGLLRMRSRRDDARLRSKRWRRREVRNG